MRFFFALLSACSLAVPTFADETEGLILSFDRVDRVLVLTDLTVWELPVAVQIPADLGRGDRVVIDFESEGEEGLTAITALDRTAAAIPEGTDGGS